MTKLEAHFKLGTLDPDSFARLSNINSIYGILRVTFRPPTNDLTVEYDGTRLQEKDVEAALAQAGIPATPVP